MEESDDEKLLPPALNKKDVEVDLPEGSPPEPGDIVDKIRIAGNRRVENESILEKISTEVGASVDRETISSDIKSIYGTGYFRNIRVDATVVDGGTLIVTYIVDEKPAISKVEFEGNNALDKSEIEDVVNLERHRILDIGKVKRNAQKIKDLYAEEGYYLAEVNYTIGTEQKERGLASVTFQIKEFQKVEVRRIAIKGNKALSDGDLKSIMKTKEGGHLSFLTNSGNYQQQAFQKDVKRITQYYYTKGYVTVRVGDPVIELSKDKRFLSIVIPVDEGDKFFAGSVDITGELIKNKSGLVDKIKLSEGDLFDYSQVSRDVRNLMRIYQDQGYANANVTPLTSIDREANEVQLKYDIQKGRKVYFGRIEIRGNTKTRDPVIRRELEFQEGDLYSQTKINRSKKALRRLGFFKNIQFKTREGTNPKKVKVVIELDERETGQFQIGAGFSSTESFVGNARISQDNLFGRGQSLSLQAQLSGIRQQFNLSFREPWFFGTRWQFSFQLFNSSLLFNDFSEQRTGGSITLGYPVSESFGWKLENNGEVRVEGTYQLQDVDLAAGGRTGQTTSTSSSFFRGGLTSSLEFRTTYDTRNNVLFPTDGEWHWASVEIADDPFTLSRNEFVKYDAQVRWYFPLIWKFAGRLSAEIGYVASTDPKNPVPLSERYLVGGPRTIRGFERYTLGGTRSVATSLNDPAASLTGFNIGGNKQLIFTGEIQFPILKPAGLKGVLFADAGNGFNSGKPYSLRMDLFSSPKNDYQDVLRTAVGFGFRWRSPIAPLRFEWGFPLQRLRSEKPVVFEFSFGRAF